MIRALITPVVVHTIMQFKAALHAVIVCAAEGQKGGIPEYSKIVHCCLNKAVGTSRV